MIRHALLTTQLRFFINDPGEDAFAPYDAICTLFWESPSCVMIVGLHGEVTRKLFRELVGLLYDLNVKVVKAYRAPGHALPFSTCIGENLYQINVEEAYQAVGAR